MSESDESSGQLSEESLFQAAIQLQSEQRARYLDAACRGNAALRRRVDTLLAAHERSDFFLETEPEPVRISHAQELKTAPGDAAVGQTIDRYRLLEKIGEGGCGVVYVAAQTEPVRRRVALKVIKLGMDTKAVVARFEAERQALALMDHPNIAKVLDAGATETGRPFFVMELVRGIRITDYCDEAKLGTTERLRLFIKVCMAIQHAHQKGIIHRDIKPSNILVTLHDGVAVPKVIDFGIAKAIEGRLTDATVYTHLQQLIGTPAYMSPEQAEMSGLDMDTRSDIYSLGVLLYELLVGCTPLDARALVASGLDAMRKTLREQEPLSPSTRLATFKGEELTDTAKRRRVEVPKLISLLQGDLDCIVMKCLEKDRTQRYETANGLAKDLERHLENEPILARPPSDWYRLQKLMRRHRQGVAAAAAIVLVLVAATVFSSWEALRARRAKRQQTTLRAEALQAKDEATLKLREAYVAQAQANRISGQAGHRFETLEVLRKAAAIRPSLQLRNEAIACLALADIRLLSTRQTLQGGAYLTTDPELERYMMLDHSGTIHLKRMSDDADLARWPDKQETAPVGAQMSPNGQFFAAPETEGKVRVWDLHTSKLALLAPMATRCQFSPDSQTLAIQQSTNVVVYSLNSDAQLKTLSQKIIPLSDKNWDLAFHPRGQLLAVSAENSTVALVFNISSGEVVQKLSHPGIIRAVAWAPQGNYLACACADYQIYVWDARTGQQCCVLKGHENAPVFLAFSHQGNLLVSSGFDNRLRLWDYRNGRQLVSISGSGAVRFSSDDRRLVCHGWESEKLSLYEVALESECFTVHERGAHSLHYDEGEDFSPTGRLLAYATPEGPRIWDFQNNADLSCSTALAKDTCSVLFSKNGDALFASSPAASIYGFSCMELPEDGEISFGPATPLTSESGYERACRSVNEDWVAAVRDNRCRVFHGKSLQPVAITSVQQGMRYVALNPAGTLVATGPWHERGVQIWDARNGSLQAQIPTEFSASVVFSPRGDLLVTSTGEEYGFWQVGSWSSVLKLTREPGDDLPGVMAFSHDGNLFAATYNRNLVKLYDAHTGEELASLEPRSTKEVTALAFDPSDGKLAVCEGPAALRVWDLHLIQTELASLGLDWPRHSHF